MKIFTDKKEQTQIMKQYMYTLVTEEDLERIADDIYGQDLFGGASSVLITIFSTKDRAGLLDHVLSFFEERFPEVSSSGCFVSTGKLQEDIPGEDTTITISVLDNVSIDAIICPEVLEKHQPSRDPLTGVYTRTEIERILDEVLSQSDICSPAILLADIDHLDQINVTLGHDAGDYVTQKVADILMQSLRIADHIGRWESEKFMIVLQHVDKNSMMDVTNRLRKLVEEADFADVGKITISFGCTLINSGEEKSVAYSRANQALKNAKENGRNCVECL